MGTIREHLKEIEMIFYCPTCGNKLVESSSSKNAFKCMHCHPKARLPFGGMCELHLNKIYNISYVESAYGTKKCLVVKESD